MPMTPNKNLRGRHALVKVDGQVRPVTVVTHIRDDVWLVEGDALPVRYQRFDNGRRTTVKRRALTLVDEP